MVACPCLWPPRGLCQQGHVEAATEWWTGNRVEEARDKTFLQGLTPSILLLGPPQVALPKGTEHSTHKPVRDIAHLCPDLLLGLTAILLL